MSDEIMYIWCSTFGRCCWGRRAHTSAPSLTTLESRVGIYLFSAPPLSHHAELFGAMLGVTFDPEMTKWRSFQDAGGGELIPPPKSDRIESNPVRHERRVKNRQTPHGV